MKQIALALVSLLISGAAAHAADSSDTPPAPPLCMKDGVQVPDDYLQLARDVITASKSADRMTLLMDAMLPALMPMARKSLPNLSDDDFASFRAAARDEMLKSLPELLSVLACVYVRHYSRDDLSGLVAWYKSPLGQKVLSESPAVVKESIPIGEAWGDRMGRNAMERVISRYRDKGNHT